jgi:hypothetical protein
MPPSKSPPIATYPEFESSAKDLVGGDALSQRHSLPVDCTKNVGDDLA